ncbi:uncharacterized protein CDAR_422821 [Caerostris darwini]|uniref:Uncharacterized protein n=1 Tax=Caerostris darwini TaxID=1538125 RepID=A0AAV4W431_9ARAC|nr:uncharacterized protein CDAR_422821 [Caerostris darwini]
MQPFLQNKNSNDSDLQPSESQMELWANCYDSTLVDPPSSAIRRWLKNSNPGNRLKMSRLKRLSTCYSKPKPSIQRMIHQMVVLRSLRGQSDQTIQHHRRAVLEQVASWLGMPEAVQEYNDGKERHQLLQLFSSSAKKTQIKQLPRDESDWSRHLSNWIRENTLRNGQDVKHRTIYKILAVDGFEGLEAKDLKNYLWNILNLKELRREYRHHLNAVRQMYEWLDTNSKVSSLMGTDSACVVCLALLHLYTQSLENVIVDDQIEIQTQRTRLWLEGYLHRNAAYYKDVRKVNNEMLQTLGQVYLESFQGKEDDWKLVGKEHLTQLGKKRWLKKTCVEKNVETESTSNMEPLENME